MARRHHNAAGRACVEIFGSAESQARSPDIFNHTLLIANGCGAPIKLHICYFRSEHCVDVTATPYGRTRETLGVFPHMRDFRWEYTEGFN